jgi:hypothetical protein
MRYADISQKWFITSLIFAVLLFATDKLYQKGGSRHKGAEKPNFR